MHYCRRHHGPVPAPVPGPPLSPVELLDQPSRRMRLLSDGKAAAAAVASAAAATGPPAGTAAVDACVEALRTLRRILSENDATLQQLLSSRVQAGPLIFECKKMLTLVHPAALADATQVRRERLAPFISPQACPPPGGGTQCDRRRDSCCVGARSSPARERWRHPRCSSFASRSRKWRALTGCYGPNRTPASGAKVVARRPS